MLKSLVIKFRNVGVATFVIGVTSTAFLLPDFWRPPVKAFFVVDIRVDLLVAGATFFRFAGAAKLGVTG